MPSLVKTPYVLCCDTHDRVYLTEAEYNEQMKNPGSPWRCPICHTPASFDDEYLEAHLNSY